MQANSTLTLRRADWLERRRPDSNLTSGMVANIQAFLAAAYVAISGTYWLPGISPSIMSLAKISIFGILAFLGAFAIGRADRTTRNLYFSLALCGTLAFITCALTESSTAGIESLRNFLEPLLWLIALQGMSSQACQQFISLLKLFLALASILILYVILAYFGVVPDVATPSELLSGNAAYVGGSTISNSGFTGSRTGWGVVVGPSALLTAVLFMDGSKRSWSRTLFAVLVVVAALFSTMVAGARGGAFAIVAAIGTGIILSQRSRYTNMIVVALLVGVLVYFGAFSIIPELFFRNLDSTGSLGERLDALSTGRISSYWQGLKHWASSPLIGVGPTNALTWVNQGELLPVHNLWLRVLAETGVLVGIPVFWITGRLLKLMRKESLSPVVSDARVFNPPASVRLVLVCGLVLALVEPAVLFGSFNSNLAIWTAIWMMLKRASLIDAGMSPRESRPGGRSAFLT